MKAKYIFCKLDAILMQTKHANQLRTCLVQVPGQLHGGLHLHVVLEEALSERDLVVGLVRLGLDGRLHAGLGHLRCRSPDAAHASLTVWSLSPSASSSAPSPCTTLSADGRPPA